MAETLTVAGITSTRASVVHSLRPIEASLRETLPHPVLVCTRRHESDA
jgi:hypothetical protein